MKKIILLCVSLVFLSSHPMQDSMLRYRGSYTAKAAEHSVAGNASIVRRAYSNTTLEQIADTISDIRETVHNAHPMAAIRILGYCCLLGCSQEMEKVKPHFESQDKHLIKAIDYKQQ